MKLASAFTKLKVVQVPKKVYCAGECIRNGLNSTVKIHGWTVKLSPERYYQQSSLSCQRMFPIGTNYAYKNPFPIIREVLPIAGQTNGNDSNDSAPIESSTLKQAIEKGARILGWPGIEALMFDLEGQGIDLKDSSRYTLQQLEASFIQIFGADATPLLMERVRHELNR